MSVINIVINIFALIGIVVLTSYIVYYLWKKNKQSKTDKMIAEKSPPGMYMQQNGIKCPDYFVYVGKDDEGNYRCKNSYGLEVSPSSTITGCENVKCLTNPGDGEISFASMDDDKTWDYYDTDTQTSYTDDERKEFVGKNAGDGPSRCDWVKCCLGDDLGDVQSNAVWLGVQDYC
jgi:hypothetical protein